MSRVKKYKSINYIDAMKVRPHSFSVSGAVVAAMGSIIFFIALIAGIYGLLLSSTNNAKKSLEAVNDYINDETNVAIYQSVVRNQDVVLNKLITRKNIVDARLSSLLESPELTSDIIDSIQDSAGDSVTILKYNYSVGSNSTVLSLDLIANSNEDIPIYIDSLEEKELFSSIYYTGYTQTENGYSFILYCYLKAVDSGE